MKKILLLLLIYPAIYLGGCAHSGRGNSEHTPFIKERYYNNNGTYQGYSTENHSITRYYNTKSQYQGYSIGGKRK